MTPAADTSREPMKWQPRAERRRRRRRFEKLSRSAKMLFAVFVGSSSGVGIVVLFGFYDVPITLSLVAAPFTAWVTMLMVKALEDRQLAAGRGPRALRARNARQESSSLGAREGLDRKHPRRSSYAQSNQVRGRRER